MRKLLLKLGLVKPTTRDEFRASLQLTGRKIDLTPARRRWGHNLSEGAVWCTPRLHNGDVIITERGEFIAYNVRGCGDPPDMAFADFIRARDN